MPRSRGPRGGGRCCPALRVRPIASPAASRSGSAPATSPCTRARSCWLRMRVAGSGWTSTGSSLAPRVARTRPRRKAVVARRRYRACCAASAHRRCTRFRSVARWTASRVPARPRGVERGSACAGDRRRRSVRGVCGRAAAARPRPGPHAVGRRLRWSGALRAPAVRPDPRMDDRRAAPDRRGPDAYARSQRRTVSRPGRRAKLRGAASLAARLAARGPALPAARELTAIGHSSGWDMLAGFIVGAAGSAALQAYQEME